MKGVISLILAFAVMLVITGCGLNFAPFSPTDEGSSNPGVKSPSNGYKATREIGNLQLILQTDKETYSTGELIPLRFAAINTGSAPIKLTFSTSKEFDLIVKREGDPIWQLSFGKYYLQVITELPLGPGQPLTFKAGWLQVDNAGNQVPAGIYEIVALLPASTAGEPLESAPLVVQVKD